MDSDSAITAAASAVVLFSAVHNLWALANVICSVRWIDRARAAELPATPTTQVVLLMPMYQEQEISLQAIEHLLGLDYPADSYHVVIVTTQREAGGADKPTTSEVIAKHLRNHPAVGGRIIHYTTDGSDACKADQLNQALSWLDQERPKWWNDDVVLGVYDADSRPELHSLRDLDRAVRNVIGAQAFQQPAVYFSRFDTLPYGFRGLYLRSRPLYNLRFCLYREVPGFRRSLTASRLRSTLVRSLLASPNHFLGHGEFVRLPLLRSVGGFPPPSADTSLGTILSYMGYAIVALSSFDVGQTPGSVTGLIRQGATWYSGCALYIRDLRLALKLGVKLRPVHMLMVTRRWLENMIWCVGPIAFGLAAFYSLIRGDNAVLILAIIGFGLHLITLLVVQQSYIRWAPRLRLSEAPPTPSLGARCGMLVAYPVMLTGTCFGPLLYYVYLCRKLVTGAAVPRSKTARIADANTFT